MVVSEVMVSLYEIHSYNYMIVADIYLRYVADNLGIIDQFQECCVYLNILT